MIIRAEIKAVFLLIVALLPFQPSSLRAEGAAHRRLSASEAEQFVAAWVKSHEKSWARHEPAKSQALHRYRHLHEITPQAGWERLGVQVFASEFGRDISWGVYDVYIKHRKVYPLNTGVGDFGVTSLCVCDQTQEGTPGLVYTYASGSGISHSEIALLPPASTSSTRLKPFLALRGADLFLEKHKDQATYIYACPYVPQGEPHARFLLGRLALSSKNKHSYLHVVLEPNLSKEWRDRVWNLDH